jgi:hypothetical protein
MKAMIRSNNTETKTVEPKKIRFKVEIELQNGAEVMVFNGVEAQTRSEAIGKVQGSLVFTANKAV